MTREILLLVGVTAAVVFFTVLLREGARRPGYEPTYHTGSELELGERGWIQRANFFVMGSGVLAFAVGVQQTLETLGGALLLAIFGVGLIVAGVFAPDPVRGYPPGAPTEPSARPTRTARIPTAGSVKVRAGTARVRPQGHEQWSGRPVRKDVCV